jgi:hypothetical protein
LGLLPSTDEDAVGEFIAALLAHLGFKPKAKSSSPLKRTKDVVASAFQPVLTGFSDEPWVLAQVGLAG